RLLTGHSQKSWLITGVRAVAFSADGEILATGGSDKVVKLWNTKTWQEICTLTGYPDAITSLSFSPFNQTLISAASSTIKLSELEGNEETILTAPAPLGLVTFSTQGQIFISYGGKIGFSSGMIKTWKDVVVEKLHPEEIKAVTFSPNGQFFATGGYDKIIKLWSTNTRQLISTFIGHSDAIYSLAFCPDSSILASGSADKTIRLWKVPIISPDN
ncbi:MAG TPA: WD40 repeat domain-containing protein, partial [Cyanophyceae cyanobacterium]